jgi:hypothetical protein
MGCRGAGGGVQARGREGTAQASQGIMAATGRRTSSCPQRLTVRLSSIVAPAVTVMDFSEPLRFAFQTAST